MIWDGGSKGTLNNMINLISRNKPVMVYLINKKKVLTVENTEDLNELFRNCNKETKSLYLKLRGKGSSPIFIQNDYRIMRAQRLFHKPTQILQFTMDHCAGKNVSTY